MINKNVKVGDIFLIKLNDKEKKYFQYIATDFLQLNSDVIRVFKTVYPINSFIDLSEVVKDKIEFNAHCIIKLGIKMKLWESIGNIPYNEKSRTVFRDTNDYGSKPGEQTASPRNPRPRETAPARRPSGCGPQST